MIAHLPLRDPAPWLTTERLALHEITAYHANELHELDADPRVMRYIGSGRISTRDQIDVAMRRVPRAYVVFPGLGTWRATRRDNGDFVGWFALKYLPGTAAVELGYRLRHAAWGRGYATEGGRELVRYGFDDLGLHRVEANVMPRNAASRKLLRRLGFIEEGLARQYLRIAGVWEDHIRHTRLSGAIP